LNRFVVMVFDILFEEFKKGIMAPVLIDSSDNLCEKALSFAKLILKSSSHNDHGFPDRLVEAQIDALSYPNFLLCKPLESEKLHAEITIDQIQPILHFLKTTPAIGQWRALIIEGVEKMNRFASNALLKSIEEPPHKTCIILLTSQLFKIPATIRSRCQIWRASLLKDDDCDGLEYTNRSIDRLNSLKEVGGLSFVQEIQNHFHKPIRQIEQFAQTIAKNKKTLDVFVWLFPSLIHKCCLEKKTKIWVEAYEKVTKFFERGLSAHLDKVHFVVASFLILKNVLEKK
jgi:DNA polymerase III delta prime subunit